MATFRREELMMVTREEAINLVEKKRKKTVKLSCSVEED